MQPGTTLNPVSCQRKLVITGEIAVDGSPAKLYRQVLRRHPKMSGSQSKSDPTNRIGSLPRSSLDLAHEPLTKKPIYTNAP
jgi:hypothetical protein